MHGSLGGSQLTSAGVEFGGVNARVYIKPYGQAKAGGDVYYASSCATGRISRLLLADVWGHGNAVAATAADLRILMRRFVNHLDQTEFVRRSTSNSWSCRRAGRSRPGDATSARVAQRLLAKGVHVAVIKGGLKAWKKAGLPLESAAADGLRCRLLNAGWERRTC